MDNPKPEHVQGSPEWLAHRRNFIGASDAPAVMKESPWVTPYQLWEDKVGIGEPVEENAAMRRGTRLEPVAREAFERLMGISVSPQVVYHPEHNFLMASLDGLTLDGKVAMEIKCPGPKAHAAALRGEVPHAYWIQNQHQLACLGHDMLYYYSFDGEKGPVIEVARDEKYIKKLITEEQKFWDCVKTFSAPAFLDRDYKDNPHWGGEAQRIAEIDQELKALDILKQERDDIKANLIMDAAGRSGRCGRLTLGRSFPKGRVDYKSIPELKGVNLDLYRAPSAERWTLRYNER